MEAIEKNLDSQRLNEMNRWGRTVIYPIMRGLVDKQSADILDLVNHGLAMVDDEIDLEDDPLQHLERVQVLFKRSYSGRSAKSLTPSEQFVVELGGRLGKMSRAGWFNFRKRFVGSQTYEEVKRYWEIEKKNFARRWEILDRETLDELNRDIGASVGFQFLNILDFQRLYNEFYPLARTYGLAVKLADNLCDFREDITRGFVNVPKEDIHHVRGISIDDSRVTQVYSERLGLSREYAYAEYQRIEQYFASADRLLLIAKARRPVWGNYVERLSLFGRFCHSWLDQAKDFVSRETSI